MNSLNSKDKGGSNRNTKNFMASKQFLFKSIPIFSFLRKSFKMNLFVFAPFLICLFAELNNAIPVPDNQKPVAVVHSLNRNVEAVEEDEGSDV